MVTLLICTYSVDFWRINTISTRIICNNGNFITEIARIFICIDVVSEPVGLAHIVKEHGSLGC